MNDREKRVGRDKLHHTWRHSSEKSIQYHGLPELVGMRFLHSTLQSSFYECADIWRSNMSRNSALVDENVYSSRKRNEMHVRQRHS